MNDGSVRTMTAKCQRFFSSNMVGKIRQPFLKLMSELGVLMRKNIIERIPISRRLWYIIWTSLLKITLAEWDTAFYIGVKEKERLQRKLVKEDQRKSSVLCNEKQNFENVEKSWSLPTKQVGVAMRRPYSTQNRQVLEWWPQRKTQCRRLTRWTNENERL